MRVLFIFYIVDYLLLHFKLLSSGWWLLNFVEQVSDRQLIDRDLGLLVLRVWVLNSGLVRSWEHRILDFGDRFPLILDHL